MIPNITRGGSVRGALDYDASKGHRGEHVNPHLITGSDAVRLETGYLRVKLTTANRKAIAEVLDAPRNEWGREIRQRDKTNGTMKTAHVWRCSLTLAPGEKLSEDRWAAVGRRFVVAMGLGECEWALTHHGGSGRDGLDHTHLTVNLVQRDGKAAKVGHDYRRAQAACSAISRALGLTELAGQQRHMPLPERRRVPPRKLTQGIRYELLQRFSAAGGEQVTEASLREHGVLVRQSRGSEAYAVQERPDVWVPASDLIGRMHEHQAARDLERQEPTLRPGETQSERGYDPNTGWGPDRDIGR